MQINLINFYENILKYLSSRIILYHKLHQNEERFITKRIRLI